MPAKEVHHLRTGAVDRMITLRVAADMFELFLYGLYVSVFVFCMHALMIKRRSTKWPFIAATLLMFATSTTDMALTMYYLFRYTLNGLIPPYRYPRIHLFITNNIFADVILIYRFYLAWHRNKRLIIPPLFVLFGSSICGYLFANATSTRFHMLYPVSMWMIFGLNMSLTLSIGGKIFWSRRQARSIIGAEIIVADYSVHSLIINSGSLYSMYLLLDQLLHSIFLRAGLGQIAGMIATTIIIRTFANRQSFLSEATDLHRGAAGSSSTPVLDSIFSTVGDTGAPNTATHSLRGESSLQGTLPQEHPLSDRLDF